jgi:hypothetical protein
MRELTSRHGKPWAPAEDDFLRLHYGPQSAEPLPRRRIALALGRTVDAVQNQAHHLNLTRHYAKSGGLTARQRQVLRLIVSHLLEVGRPPTFRWLMERLDIGSPNGMMCHFEALAKKGYIEVDHFEAHGVRLVGAKLTLAYHDDEQGRRLREALEGT